MRADCGGATSREEERSARIPSILTVAAMGVGNIAFFLIRNASTNRMVRVDDEKA
jgi:hypothetical protein